MISRDRVSWRPVRSLAAALLVAALLGAGLSATRASAAMPRTITRFDRTPIVPFAGKLFDGRSVTVDRKGAVRVGTTLGKKTFTEQRVLSSTQWHAFGAGAAAVDRARALFQLAQPRPAAYSPHDVLVVFKPGTTIPNDSFTVPAATLSALRSSAVARPPSSSSIGPPASPSSSASRALPSSSASIAANIPRYTTDARANTVFAQLGVSRTDRLFAQIPRGTLTSSAARAAAGTRRPVLDLGNAFRLRITNAPLPDALRALAKLSTVAYVGRDYVATTMTSGAVTLPASAVREAQALHPRRAFGRSSMPLARGTRSVMSVQTAVNPALDNYAVAASAQPMLNAPGVDAVAAFDEIAQKFPGQLPGAGVTITNVSLGDLDDASAATNSTDPCNLYVTNYGPTTHLIGAQRYVDLPSMPLIPAYVGSPNGTLSGNGEVCGIDPFLGEIALDFSVMAPLPHALQRPAELGSGLSDLLGIAPGASYRLVVPAAADEPSILGALLAAATQSPAPDIITTSIGWGLDRFGFPSRYLEDDALSRSVAATITGTYNIPLFIAANDGTRSGTGAPIGPSGGAAPTNLVPSGAPFTTLDDIGLTTAASAIPDTGAIDVGGTTVDDTSSANPADPANAALASAHAFPDTRFNGSIDFATGFGSRVNLSAPADSILTLVRFGPSYDSTFVGYNGGSSAAAPEAAAVAAIAVQVARLEGHPFTSPAALRAYLAATGTQVAQSAVTDIPLNVGTQVSARRVVEQLLADARVAAQPSVGRVAIAQRKVAFDEVGQGGETLLEYTDPAIISLRLPLDATGQYTGARTNDYITIAPDWENLPANAQFKLTIAGKPSTVLATTPFARLLPSQILAAAGLPLASTSVRTVSLTYQSTVGLHVAAQTAFDLTFGPADGTSTVVLAPVIAPVISGSTMSVTYDASLLPARLGTPYLEIWLPDRFDLLSRIIYSQPLTAPKGTINVPVSALGGAGVYQAQLWYGGPSPATSPTNESEIGYSRVSVAGASKPPPPLLGTASSPSGHSLEVPYAQPITIGWNVSNVPGASGALLEVSFGAPNIFGNFNPFNNPNGSAIDADGVDTGSIYHQAVSGISGTITIDPRTLGVLPGVFHSIRVLPASGGAIVGEASDTSAFEMDGVVPPDGGAVYTHGINTSGNDGFLISEQVGCLTIGQNNVFQGPTFQPLATGHTTGSAAMTFDQTSLQITNPNVTTSPDCDSQPTILANDTGLFYDRGTRAFAAVPTLGSSPSIQYLTFPVGAIPNDINFGPGVPTFPDAQGVLLGDGQDFVGGNASGSTAAFFGFRTFGVGTLNQGTAFAIDLNTLATTAVMTVNDFTTMTNPFVVGQAYDPVTNVGYYAVIDFVSGHTPATILAVNYSAQTHSVFSSGGEGFGTGSFGASFLALDPTTRKLLLVNDSSNDNRQTEFHVIDLKTNAVTIVTPSSYAQTTFLDEVLADPVNALFVIIERERPADVFDVTGPSGIDFFDESGTLVKHVAIPFTSYPASLGTGIGTDLNYLNGRKRRLFVPAPPNAAGVAEPELMAIDY